MEYGSASVPLCECVHTCDTVDAWKSENGQLQTSVEGNNAVASALFARGLLSVPCVERHSNRRSGEDSKASHQENKNESKKGNIL